MTERRHEWTWYLSAELDSLKEELDKAREALRNQVGRTKAIEETGFDAVVERDGEIARLKKEVFEAREEGATLARTIAGVVTDIHSRDAEIARLKAELKRHREEWTAPDRRKA